MLYNIYFVMPFFTGDYSDWLIEVIIYIFILSCHLSLVIPVIGFEVHAPSPVILVVGIYILVLVIYSL